MDRKLTPQQELNAAKARLRAHASGLDLAVQVNRRLALSLLKPRTRPSRFVGAASSVVALLLGATKLIGTRGRRRLRRKRG